jgi:hypothetical protein
MDISSLIAKADSFDQGVHWTGAGAVELIDDACAYVFVPEAFDKAEERLFTLGALARGMDK